MRSGEEKYLPARDQGPVKRFVRDWVDSRLTFTEFLLPILVVIMLLSLGGPNSTAARFSSYLWATSILLLLVDVVWTRIKLAEALKAKFGPDEDLKGDDVLRLHPGPADPAAAAAQAPGQDRRQAE